MSRRPPVNAVFQQHLPRQRGKCRWCGLPIFGQKGDLLKNCLWHADCLHDFKIIAWPSYTRTMVSRRDRGICVDCGEDHRLTGDWEVEHNVPLWKVATIEPLERLNYFRLPALVTRCVACHRKKSAHEASERAHIKRLAKPTAQLSMPWSSQPFATNRNGKFKKKMDGTVERR